MTPKVNKLLAKTARWLLLTIFIIMLLPVVHYCYQKPVNNNGKQNTTFKRPPKEETKNDYI